MLAVQLTSSLNMPPTAYSMPIAVVAIFMGGWWSGVDLLCSLNLTVILPASTAYSSSAFCMHDVLRYGS